MRIWQLLEIVLGLGLVVFSLIDAFETIVLPRTVSRSFRLTTGITLLIRWVYETVGDLKYEKIRQRLLVALAPLSVFTLICFWAVLIITGYSLIGDGLSAPFRDGAPSDLGNRMYFSATTFLTFGFGDFIPTNPIGKWLAVLEAGQGFMFLALVIGYVPVFYSAFSSREKTILLLDSRAGSDPTACELLRRYAQADCLEDLPDLLKEWEEFSGQLLENFLSYPFLAFYRSQHDDQSWLRSLTAIMDTCTLCTNLYPDDAPAAKKIRFQAAATFAMARHLVVDFAYVVKSEPVRAKDRLPDARLEGMIQVLTQSGLSLKVDAESLNGFRRGVMLYEPFAAGLSIHVKMPLPEWVHAHALPDNWQTSAWDGSHF